MADTPEFHDRMLSLGLARVSEAAALASARLIGRGDEKAADQAAVDAMRTQLNQLEIEGVVVIGEGERDEAPMLYIGEEVGSGSGPKVDIALDPLEGTTLTAKDMPNALAVIAMGPRGTMLHAPDVYMDKLAIGPGFDPDTVTLEMTPTERVVALARAKGCTPGQLAMAWLLAQGKDIVVIPGTKRVERVEENMGAASVTLSADEGTALSAAFPPGAGAGTRYPAGGMKGVFI